MLERELVHEISAENTIAYLKDIVAVGPRYHGSENDHKAANYILRKFKENGLFTTVEEFTSPCFEEIDFSLKILEPTEKNIKCMPIWYCPPTPAKGITAELEYVGTARKNDYLNKKVENKIIIFKRDPKEMKENFWEEACIASRNGAVGAIMVNFDPYPFRTTLETGYFDPQRRLQPIKPRPLPILIISSDDGEYILNSMENHKVKVHMKAITSTKDKPSKNVRGLLTGTKRPEEKVLVVAHRDSAGVPGADDNASGTAVMMEVARVLSKRKPERTVEFVSLGAEEGIGSMGSLAYVRMHKEELDRILCVINIDGVGFGHLWVVEGGRWLDREVKTTKWLNQLITEVAKKLGYVVYPGYCSYGSSDEGRFIDAGVDAAWLWRPALPYFHTEKDTPDTIDPNVLKVVADIVAVAVWELANEEKSVLESPNLLVKHLQ